MRTLFLSFLEISCQDPITDLLRGTLFFQNMKYYELEHYVKLAEEKA